MWQKANKKFIFEKMLESVEDKIKTSYKAKRNLSKVNLCLILSTAYLVGSLKQPYREKKMFSFWPEEQLCVSHRQIYTLVHLTFSGV